MNKLRFRLALDLGSTSLGWSLIRLDVQGAPCAVIKAGVRIFSDGRNPKDGASLAVTRREARAMRRRRDRLLKRKSRMLKTLVKWGFFPSDTTQRKTIELMDPYVLRAKGLDHTLTPAEFGRVAFHLNQRRGFKSNRKTDKADNDASVMNKAIGDLRHVLQETGCRTVGEFLHQRIVAKQTVRARYREQRVLREDGKTRIEKSYDLYIDRAMIEAEFDVLWAAQAKNNPTLFNQRAQAEIRDCLLHQRPLKPVQPGRCTLLPQEPRAPLALPSQQRFRIYQEVNNLRILRNGVREEPLTIQQRDQIVQALEVNSKRTFHALKQLLGLDGSDIFNLEGAKRDELKGNATSVALSKREAFGHAWASFGINKQDAIVMQLVQEENEASLIHWLQGETGVSAQQAERIASMGLPEGYGSLSATALDLILPTLAASVCSYSDAARAAGFHHSQLDHDNEVPGLTFPIENVVLQTGEIKTLHVFKELPFYGEYLQRHVGFGSGKPEDPPEKRFGKVGNPTVHIGLNQVRVVVNALIARYGHPAEVVIELARELKQSREQRTELQKQQAENQRRNQARRKIIADILRISAESVKPADLQKMILWEELSRDAADRRCPYSGAHISAAMLLSDQIEIEHILPFSKTLDDSLNNKTVATRQANRIKGNRTPWDARHDFTAQGWAIDHMLERARQMPLKKRYRFFEDGYEKWLREDKDFLARALNDTRHLSRVATEYLRLVCPQSTRVIPGQMTALLRGKFGLNHVLGLDGEKNRNDHRHHAVDACVIGVTDQGLLQRFAQASASAREGQLNRLVANMPMPWGDSDDGRYFKSVQRAIAAIHVSHKPDHGFQGAMHEATAWGILPGGQGTRRERGDDGRRHRVTENKKLIPLASTRNPSRHGLGEDGQPKPYKGYVGGSNYCIEIVKSERGKWEGEVISTFQAYQIIRQLGPRLGAAKLRSPKISLSGRPLIMRLQIGDTVRLEAEDSEKLMRVATIKTSGNVIFAPHNEANVDARDRDNEDPFSYLSKTAGSLQKVKARRVTVSPCGELRDPGFPG